MPDFGDWQRTFGGITTMAPKGTATVVGKLFVGLWLLFLTVGPAAAKCESAPFGEPSPPVQTIDVCHAGYLSIFDPSTKVTRAVTYRLTAAHTFGCLSRGNLKFKIDDGAPAGDQGRASDYSHTAYDLGHMAPNADFAWSDAQQRDTFSMLNVAPQVHKLNQQGWERGEETVRAWAFQRGEVVVFVGPIFAKDMGKIGTHDVVVPSAFWKVVVDAKAGEAIAFEMENVDTPKGSLEPFLKSVADVERDSDVVLPIPTKIDPEAAPVLWPADLKAWKDEKKRRCAVSQRPVRQG